MESEEYLGIVVGIEDITYGFFGQHTSLEEVVKRGGGLHAMRLTLL